MSQPPRIGDSHVRTTSTRSVGITATDSTDENSTPLNHDAVALHSPPQEDLTTSGEANADALAQTCVLIALPLDILIEILAHVDPLSLRRLSRTSRALRDTLADPSSDWIWRASYAVPNHGLSPAPEDISIPQFLDLLVDRTCDFCHALVSPKDKFERIWTARMRCCGRCLEDETHFIFVKDMRKQQIVRDVQRYLGRVYDLQSLFPASLPSGWDFGTYKFPRVLVLRFAADFARDTHGKSEEDKRAWMIQKRKNHAIVSLHAETCSLWEFDERLWPQIQPKHALKEKRREAIAERLQDLEIECAGCDPSDLKQRLLERLRSLPRSIPGVGDTEYRVPVHSTPVEVQNLADKAELLSEEDWLDIRNWLLEAAKAEIRRTVLDERFCVLQQAYAQFLEHKQVAEIRTLPSTTCLANWEEVVDLIEGTPIEQHLTAEDMRAFIDGLAETRFSEWRAAFEDELVAKLNAADPERELPATTADLPLATSVFCMFQDNVQWYDTILRWEPFSLPPEYPPPSYCSLRQQLPWSAHETYVEPWRQCVAAQLVSLSGLDPATATYSDMDACPLWFALSDDLALIHEGKKVNFAEEDDVSVVLTQGGVDLARAWLADPSALVIYG
ncbi:hypothetical protein EV121DRAFT_295971 [Schizophyllum commune]